MKIKNTILLYILLCSSFIAFSQTNTQTKSDIQGVTEAINHYLEGTKNGEPERLNKAFHPDFNLYYVDKDSIRIRSGKKYISQIKHGEVNNRIGRIISIDIEGNAAMAKAEVTIPKWRVFTDYFLLLKVNQEWKIVQKSYTYRSIDTRRK